MTHFTYHSAHHVPPERTSQPPSIDSDSHDAPDQPTSTSASTITRVPLIIHPLRHLDLSPAHPSTLLHTAAGVEPQLQALPDTGGSQTAFLGAADPMAETLHTILRAALSNLDGLEIQLGDCMTGSDDTYRIHGHHRGDRRRGQKSRHGDTFRAPRMCWRRVCGSERARTAVQTSCTSPRTVVLGLDVFGVPLVPSVPCTVRQHTSE